MSLAESINLSTSWNAVQVYFKSVSS